VADGVRLRLARPEERAELEALQWRASLVWADHRQDLLDHPDAIALPVEQIVAGQIEIAERGGRVLGFSAVLAGPDSCVELDGLFVEPDAWRCGIGRALVESAARRARPEGARAMMVTGNPNAAGLYRACGFVEVGEAETRFGPAPRFHLALGHPC
jgi:GNAT superfamily N-acetyltransferase